MIRHIRLAAGTPIEIVRALRPIDRRVALISLADAAPTITFATTVVVGNDVVLAVRRVSAGADPGDVRLHGARRTTASRATATSTEKTVDRTMSPVVAAIGIAFFSNARGGKGTVAINRQQRKGARTDQQGAQAAEKTSTRRAASGLSGEFSVT